MAVSIDRVYQKVLALANKEQRGYITPQEFNLFADQAQMDIFEQYFYDLEQRQRAPGNSFDYADIVSNIEEKISMFDIHDESHTGVGGGVLNLSDLGGVMWRLGSVKVLYSTNPTFVGFANVNKYREAEQVQQKEISQYLDSYLTNRFGGPYYTRYSTSGIPMIRIFPDSFDDVIISYIRKPNTPAWTYVIVDGTSASFNSGGGFIDFELHDSEENKLVVKILQLAGVAIKDPALIQASTQQEIKNVQQEKQ